MGGRHVLRSGRPVHPNAVDTFSNRLDHLDDDLGIVDIEQQIEGKGSSFWLSDHVEIVIQRRKDQRSEVFPFPYELLESTYDFRRSSSASIS